jgi:hypothetical protein
VTLLWLPPHPEDSIPGLISGPGCEPASSQRGSLDTGESFDFRAPIPQAFPNLAPSQTSHKRQISEAIPRSERLKSPETAPAAALEQGPERTQEEEAAGTGPRKSGRIRGPKRPKLRCKQCLGIARLAAVVTPVTVIHSTAGARTRNFRIAHRRRCTHTAPAVV